VTSFPEYAEVRDLLERSSDAINHQDWARLATMMTDDVVWERRPPLPWTLTGLQAVRAFLAKNLTKLVILHYDISSSAVELVDATHATCRSTMNELIHLHESKTVLRVIGTYDDEFTKSEGTWQFTRRTMVPSRKWLKFRVV
jgi:hypothetical protein